MAFWSYRIRGNQITGMSLNPRIADAFNDVVEENNHPGEQAINIATPLDPVAGAWPLIYDPAVPEVRFMDGGSTSGPEHTQAEADAATDAVLEHRARIKAAIRNKARRAMLRLIVRYVNQTFRLAPGQSTKTLQQILQDFDASTDAGDND